MRPVTMALLCAAACSDPSGAPQDTDEGRAATDVAYDGPPLFLNEVMPDAVDGAPSPAEGGDWVEIHNPNDEGVALDDVWLDNGGEADHDEACATLAAEREGFRFPPGTTIPARGHLLVGYGSWSGVAAVVVDGHPLGKDEDILVLYVEGSDGGSPVVDCVDWHEPVAAPDSLARSPDGGEAWVLAAPTPGAPNP